MVFLAVSQRKQGKADQGMARFSKTKCRKRRKPPKTQSIPLPCCFAVVWSRCFTVSQPSLPKTCIFPFVSAPLLKCSILMVAWGVKNPYHFHSDSLLWPSDCRVMPYHNQQRTRTQYQQRTQHRAQHWRLSFSSECFSRLACGRLFAWWSFPFQTVSNLDLRPRVPATEARNLQSAQSG